MIVAGARIVIMNVIAGNRALLASAEVADVADVAVAARKPQMLKPSA